ncbi:trichohyalin-like isoform X17 [Saccostrea cucullata]|uniref:trichohyalin-like isoform X17 n=1 Tax=Saccostrea cuccullata TaxID=36930 RepID=UPI002ED31F6F
MSAAMVDRNADYPSADYGRPMYDSRPQNDYGHPSYDYNRPTYDSYQQPGDYNRSSYDPPRAQERYDQPSQYQRAPDPPVITSGIVSLSDEKAKERKHLIQMEMRKEYEDHMRRQKPVYYTTGGPEQGLPIGNYGQTRKILNDERHRDYNKFMKEKEEQASRHRDEMLQQRQVSPPRQPQAEMYDHNQMSQTLREERKKEYNDYLENPRQRPSRDGRPLGTPSQQQKEQILNRAQHQLEIPVIDRRQANSDPPPPLDLSQAQDRPPSGRWDPDSYRQSNFGAVKRVTSPPHQANIGHDDYGSYRRQTEHEVRNKEYNEFLAKKQHMEDEKRMKLVEQRRQAPAPIIKGDYYSSEQYDHKRQALRDQQHREYQNYLKSQPATPPEAYGLPIGQQHYIPKQKWMERQRNMEYNQLLRKQHDQNSKRAPTPDYLQGLPLSQRQYDNMRKMQEKQRNQEYNQLLAKKGFDRHQPPETNRRPELGMRSEFQDQEPAGRQSQRNVPVGSLITGDRVDYPSSANVKFNNERRREYNEYIKPQDLKNIHRKREEAISKIESDGIDLDKVRIFPQGEYQDKQKQLQEEWRKNFRDFAAKKHEIVKKELEEREREIAKYYQKEIDNPHILPVGEYKDRQKVLQRQWREECRDYYSGHPVVQKSKEIWKEDEPVHTIPQSGEYKGRRERLNNALREEFKEYQSQKPPPKERVKVFGQQGAVLFDPLYNKDTKDRVREERSKDFQEFLEQKQEADRYRRQDNNRSENRIGFMSQLGKPVEEIRERLAKERHEDYNKYLQSKYNSQSQQRPLERPKWVDPKIMEDNWQKEAGGSRSNSRPPSNKPVQTPTYEEMLQRKRREEASYRRYDDPEYSRSGDPGRRPMP